MNIKQNDSTPHLIAQRIAQAPQSTVWTPRDFFDLGNKEVVKKAMQRMVASKQLRRIGRGFYDQPFFSTLTCQLSVPNYNQIIDAIHRTRNIRVLIDGIVAANDLGLTNAVPGKVIIHTDARLRPIRLNNLVIRFKLASPSRMYWAGRPAMRIVQALYWLRDTQQKVGLIDEPIVRRKLTRLLKDKKYGTALLDDLMQGLHTLPAWMQAWVKDLYMQVKN